MKRKKRHVLSVLGVSVLASLGLMAFTASAQAQLPVWKINGAAVSTFPTQFHAENTLWWFNILGVRFGCITNTHAKGNLTATSSLSVNYSLSGCKVVEGEEGCKLAGSEIKAEATALTITGSGDRVRFSPPVSGIFGKVTLEDNEFECILIEPEAGKETLDLTGDFCGLFEGSVIKTTLAIRISCLFAGQVKGLFLGNNEVELEKGGETWLRTSDGKLITL